MQVLMLLWSGEYLVGVECYRTYGDSDLIAGANRVRKQFVYDDMGSRPNRCTIYTIKDGKLILRGEEGDA